MTKVRNDKNIINFLDTVKNSVSVKHFGEHLSTVHQNQGAV